MKNSNAHNQNSVSNRELKDFFTNSRSVEEKKEQSERKIMHTEMQRATGGKSIVFSNKCQ